MPEQQLLAALRGRQAAMAATLVEWAEINSGSRNLDGLAEMRARIADRLESLADAVTIHSPDPVTTLDDSGAEIAVPHGANLLARKRPERKRRLILTGHMDTVFAADHPFQQCRRIDANTLGGPGTADMKGGLLVMIEALAALEAVGAVDAIGWDIVVNADEEVGSLGSASLLRETARRCQIGLTFEPTITPEGRLASARRGSGNFVASIAGRAAHAGRNPQDGSNAVVAAADLAMRLDGLKHAIPGLSVNVARVTGGGANNVVPDAALLSWNMRPLDAEAQQRAEQAMAAALEDVRRTHEVAIHLAGGFARPPKPFDARHALLFGLVRDAGADLGLAIDWQPSGGVCDGNNIAAENVVVVDTMGVRGGAIHTDGEYVLLDSLSERAALAAVTIARIAQGRLDGIIGQPQAGEDGTYG